MLTVLRISNTVQIQSNLCATKY